MTSDTQSQSAYIVLEFCTCKQEFTKNHSYRNDFGDVGTLINYSIVVAGAGLGALLEEYMGKQGVAKGINFFYQYKLIGNFGVFSYLFKKAEGKDDKRAIQETIFESGMSYALGKMGKNIGISAKQIVKK